MPTTNGWKIIILFIALTAINADDDQHEHAPFHGFLPKLTREIFRTCLTESGITFDRLKIPEDTEMQSKKLCFQKCAFTAGGLITEDGDINTDAIKFEDGSGSKSPMKLLNETQRSEFVKCLDGITDKITSCDDVKKMTDCLPFKPNLGSQQPE